jgi:hypothetical protein
MSTTFGRNPGDVTPQRYSYYGQNGWWTVPQGWTMWTDTNFQIWASPNADHSMPNYAVKINADGKAIFFDMMRNRMAGIG